ncbi:MAG TPA: hypothetical protein VEB20_14765 [Azospirillaceae bacterium]|nr:hypothetical protein [Azospirillaceae bacterium]
MTDGPRKAGSEGLHKPPAPDAPDPRHAERARQGGGDPERRHQGDLDPAQSDEEPRFSRPVADGGPASSPAGQTGTEAGSSATGKQEESS